MKTISQKYTVGKFLMVIIMIAAVCSFTSCAKKINFLVSTVVPAARGTVKVSQDRNKNYVIEVNLVGLAEVERLEPSKKVYVVWMISEKDLTINLGQMISFEKGIRNVLRATFSTTSAFKPSKIMITAEDNAGVQYPDGQIILSTSRF